MCFMWLCGACRCAGAGQRAGGCGGGNAVGDDAQHAARRRPVCQERHLPAHGALSPAGAGPGAQLLADMDLKAATYASHTEPPRGCISMQTLSAVQHHSGVVT